MPLTTVNATNGAFSETKESIWISSPDGFPAFEPSSLNVTRGLRRSARDIQRFFGGGFSVTTGLGARLSFGGGFRFSFGGVFTFSFGGGFTFSFGGVFVFVTGAGFVNGFSQTPSRNVPPCGHAQVLSSSFRGGSH